jgi:hypothetical protein
MLVSLLGHFFQSASVDQESGGAATAAAAAVAARD